jgi:hypothetical protein
MNITEVEISLVCRVNLRAEEAQDYVAEVFEQLENNNLIILPDTIETEVRSEQD